MQDYELVIILFIAGSIVAIFSTYYFANVYYDENYHKSLVQLNNDNSCTSLIIFDNQINGLSISDDQENQLHKIVIYKSGALHCP